MRKSSVIGRPVHAGKLPFKTGKLAIEVGRPHDHERILALAHVRILVAS
jgi:hypothetical protein